MGAIIYSYLDRYTNGIDSSALIDMKVPEALNYIRCNDVYYNNFIILNLRIVEYNGVEIPSNLDISMSRLNVKVRDDVIIEVISCQ